MIGTITSLVLWGLLVVTAIAVLGSLVMAIYRPFLELVR